MIINFKFVFSCTCMVRAAGSLMKFVDKNYRLDNGEPDVLFIAPLDLGTIMSLDSATLTSLQIFSSRSQLSAHKGFTITPNVNYKCPRSVAAIALPVAAMALPQPPIYLKLT